ncbi:Hypothetical protein A7982_07921 [Minicystis rosea]|nr:Hypothetical protein A7982_07921 [Minicystis rosea]
MPRVGEADRGPEIRRPPMLFEARDARPCRFRRRSRSASGEGGGQPERCAEEAAGSAKGHRAEATTAARNAPDRSFDSVELVPASLARNCATRAGTFAKRDFTVSRSPPDARPA